MNRKRVRGGVTRHGGGNILLGKGSKHWVEYKYERLNSFCFYCGFLGHDVTGCGVREEDNRAGCQIENRFGEELKAGAGARRGVGGGPDDGGRGGEVASRGLMIQVSPENQTAGGSQTRVEVSPKRNVGENIGQIGGNHPPNQQLIEITDNAVVTLNGKEICMRDLVPNPADLNFESGGKFSDNGKWISHVLKEAHGPVIGPILSETAGKSHTGLPPTTFNYSDGLDGLSKVEVLESPSDLLGLDKNHLSFKVDGRGSVLGKNRRVGSGTKTRSRGVGTPTGGKRNQRAISLTLGKKRDMGDIQIEIGLGEAAIDRGRGKRHEREMEVSNEGVVASPNWPPRDQ